ncbi:MAG: hypothetical protein QG608_3167 [Actinomycetota bacterium]|nr:hypothetical protein [Actinomycetota bacterium]
MTTRPEKADAAENVGGSDTRAAHPAGDLSVGVLRRTPRAADLRGVGADAALEVLRSFTSWFAAGNSPAPGPETGRCYR